MTLITHAGETVAALIVFVATMNGAASLIEAARHIRRLATGGTR